MVLFISSLSDVCKETRAKINTLSAQDLSRASLTACLKIDPHKYTSRGFTDFVGYVLWLRSRQIGHGTARGQKELRRRKASKVIGMPGLRRFGCGWMAECSRSSSWWSSGDLIGRPSRWARIGQSVSRSTQIKAVASALTAVGGDGYGTAS
jgi:hypothetical protein